MVVSKQNVRKNKVRSPQLPNQKRVNLPKETRNPYCVLASWRNRFGNGFREWLTCMAVRVSSWQPQLSTLNQSEKICLILKNMNTHFVIITIIPELGWWNWRKFNLTFTIHKKNLQVLTSIASLILFLMSRIFCFFSLWGSEEGLVISSTVIRWRGVKPNSDTEGLWTIFFLNTVENSAGWGGELWKL